ncbi:MAG TPA: efflux RND transporter periplasmic adaptor subunit [Steroidobacteraceae bacterium]|nr:efflux RND transporter periplasmic adaptor subunit [Steroidobacteraceae bacterium]
MTTGPILDSNLRRLARVGIACTLSGWPVGLLAAALLLNGCGKSSPPAQAPVPVTTIQLSPRPVSIAEEYPAQLEASNTVEIRPRVGGILERQAALEGQAVKAGQVLFEIDAQPYRAALEQAQATLAQASAAQAQARRDLARAEPLSKVDALSQRELDAAVAQNAATTAQVRAAQAAVKTARLNLDYTVVTAPIDGVMSRAQIRVGGLVSAYNTLLTTVYKTDPMYVNFSISEQRLLQLQRELGRAPDQRNRSQRTFHVFLADGQELPIMAQLNFVDAAVDARTDTLPVRLTVANSRELLRAGEYVKVSIQTRAQPEALLVPQRAVQELQDKSFVWIVGADGRAQTRDVTLGARIGPDRLVVKGLSAGDTVIVDGIQKLKPGTPVATSALPAAEKQLS